MIYIHRPLRLWAGLVRVSTSTVISRRPTRGTGSSYFRNLERKFPSSCIHVPIYINTYTVWSWYHSISAVCRGATLWGLEQNHATSFLSRIARTSYGVCFAVPYEPGNPNHLQSDKWWDEAESIWRVNNQMRWLLKRVCAL